ncbi:hypothetical protein TcasGA2_TC006335 [Tribolium castaneum]|uniref:F-box domain-containing protein n=1 Tax=Tribolium castaneum TaxID=7070 RepID=D6WW56_TRICA|nr:hypothetical protein TcasGA2_TC006335 [Tribolium castaneum]
MIESPSCHAEALQHEIHKSVSSLHQRLVAPPTDLTQKIQQLIHGNTILTYYLRMSWLRKLSFLNELIKRIKSLDTMRLVIDTLQPLLGKLTSYCKSTTATPMNFDKVLNDHDRMFSGDILEENIALDLAWFESIEDQEQVAYLIAFIRLSGHALIRIFIANLQSALVERLKVQALQANHIDEKEEKKNSSESHYKHDLDDPKHQKCVQLQKKWEKTIGEYRKKVLGKKKEKASTKSKDKKSKNKKTKKAKKKNKKKRKGGKDEPLDWIQIMPIMIVKKIFNHLDKKSLNRAKKVNTYWKWAIGELLKDRKARKSLNKSDKKLRKASGSECFFPESEFLEGKARVSHTERRLQKLQMRGAILEELRQNSRVAQNTNALITEAMKLAPYVSDLTMYPRVERKNGAIFKRPEFLVKDLGIICVEGDDLSESEEDTGGQGTRFSSSVASSGSDRF